MPAPVTATPRKFGNVVPGPLPNAAGKLDRARQLLIELEQAIGSYLEAARWQLAWATDPSTKELVFTITMQHPLPASIEGIIGDALSNMRSALNLMISDLVRANGQSVTRQTAFPSAESEQKYRREAPKRLQGLSQKAVKLIDRLKPYAGARELFWRLSEVRNTDDHHYILPVVLGRLSLAMRAGMPMVFMGADGALSFGGGPAGSVPMGFDQGLMSPGNATATQMIPGQAVEFYRGSPGLEQLEFEVGLNFTFMIGPEVGPIDLLYEFYALVSRTIAIAQRTLL